MGAAEVTAARRRNAMERVQVLRDRDSKRKTLEYERKQAIKGIEDKHKAEIAALREWEKGEIQMLAEKLADELVGAQQ